MDRRHRRWGGRAGRCRVPGPMRRHDATLRRPAAAGVRRQQAGRSAGGAARPRERPVAVHPGRPARDSRVPRRGDPIQDDLRLARLPGNHVVDGSQGRGRHGADPRRATGEVQDRADDHLRRFDGRQFRPDVRRVAPGSRRRRGLAQRHGEPRRVRELPGRDPRVVRRLEDRGARRVPPSQRRAHTRAARDADRGDGRGP